MKISAIVSFVFCFLALVATTVAFSSYWYYMDVDSSNGGSQSMMSTKTYLKYNGARITMNINGNKQSIESGYPDSYKAENKHQIEIFNASLAFDILAWITLLIASIILILQIIGKLELIPIPMISMIGKFILCISSVFCLISMFVFLGLPRSREQDCRNQNMAIDQSSIDLICGSDAYTKFVGSISEGATSNSTSSSATIKWGPSTSWIAVVIGTGFSLAACFTTIFAGVFVNNTPGN